MHLSLSDTAYNGNDAGDQEVFGVLEPGWYTPPERFEHFEFAIVARIPKVEGGDGNPSIISEARCPARFYRLEVLESLNSVGDVSPGFTLDTGSGIKMGKLCVLIALAARDGGIGIRTKGQP